METYQQLENDLPKDADERAAMVARLLDLIERKNAAVERYNELQGEYVFERKQIKPLERVGE